MSRERIIMVTGVAGYWGERLARQLLADNVTRVIGLDQEPLAKPIAGLDFVQADFRDPLLIDLLTLEQVDTVCHMAFWETTRHSEAAFDMNVMGAMKLFSVCAAAGVRQIVYRSSTELYGAHPDNPAHLREEHALRASGQIAYNRYRLEMEHFCNGFSRQYPDTSVALLRFAGIVGPTSDTPLTRYLDWRATPTLVGFNPMMQVVHEDDVVSALAHATMSEAAGVFNVAADPPLPLKRMLALAKTRPLPLLHPLAYSKHANPYARRMSLAPDYLRFRWTVDTTRMTEVLGFSPQFTADEALESLTQRKRSRWTRQHRDADEKPLPLHMVIEARRAAKVRIAPQ